MPRWSLAALALLPLFLAADWPQFRGPQGAGVSDASGLPLTWSDDDNVVWRRSSANQTGHGTGSN